MAEEQRELALVGEKKEVSVAKAVAREKARAFVAAYAKAYVSKYNARPEELNDGKVRGQILNWIKDYPLERACELIQVYLQLDSKWFRQRGHCFETFRANLNTIGQALDSGTDPEKQAVDWNYVFGRAK